MTSQEKLPHQLQPTEDGVALEEHALATRQVSSALVIVAISPLTFKSWDMGLLYPYSVEHLQLITHSNSYDKFRL